MTEREKLQQEIEQVRNVLDNQLADCSDLMECYDLNCQLDKLIEKYLDAVEEEKNVSVTKEK
ncbi:MAG: hypothetical protein HFG80_01905 [Eubacterium sp.]|jgi:hypothetical protein|nr:hypothetical protein [Eubacterium sp.]